LERRKEILDPNTSCKLFGMKYMTVTVDLGYTWDKFTWHRGLIRERLDPALSNNAWNLKF
jgi:hypothetical protein